MRAAPLAGRAPDHGGARAGAPTGSARGSDGTRTGPCRTQAGFPARRRREPWQGAGSAECEPDHGGTRAGVPVGREQGPRPEAGGGRQSADGSAGHRRGPGRARAAIPAGHECQPWREAGGFRPDVGGSPGGTRVQARRGAGGSPGGTGREPGGAARVGRTRARPRPGTGGTRAGARSRSRRLRTHGNQWRTLERLEPEGEAHARRHPAPARPRPLTGEPLALDLLNTRWMTNGVERDLLDDTDGLAAWLAANALDDRFTADEAALRHARTARDALLTAVGGDPGTGRRPWTPCSRTGGSGPRSPRRDRASGRSSTTPPGARMAGRPRLPPAAGHRAGPDPRLRPRGLHPALLRHLTQRHPPLVLHGVLRQPRQGLPPLRPQQGHLTHRAHGVTCRIRAPSRHKSTGVFPTSSVLPANPRQTSALYAKLIDHPVAPSGPPRPGTITPGRSRSFAPCKGCR